MSALTRRIVLATCAAAVTSCASASSPHRGQSTATFVDGGVHVQLRIAGSGPRGDLTATFTPQRPGFHLYSVDLPVRGIAGLGQRTAVEVTGAWRSTGALRASQAVRLLDYPSLHLALPVYPDGQLVVTSALRRGHGSRVSVLVSYAACSASTCLPPVLAHRLTLQAP